MKKLIFLVFTGVVVIILYPLYSYWANGSWHNLFPNAPAPDTSFSALSSILKAKAISSINKLKDEAVSQTVIRVVDGDTIEIDGKIKVRYIGINTPETVDPRKGVQCFGKEASAYNKNLVLNKKVKLVKDVSETDKYGRLLRYVYLEDGTFVNLKLVQEGYALVDTVPPDVAHAKEFVAAQKEAKTAKLGLWSKCK